MKCEEVRGRFSELLEKELNPLEEEEIRAHLASCPECGKDYERFQKMIRSLHSVGEVETPDDLASNVHKRIEDRKAGSKRPWYGQPLPWKIPIQAVAMVAVVVLVMYVTKMMPPSYVEEARDVRTPESGIDVEKLEKKKGDATTPPVPRASGQKTLADRSIEKERPSTGSGLEQVEGPSTGPSTLRSRPKRPGPERVEERPTGPVEPLGPTKETQPHTRGSESVTTEALVEKQFEPGPAVPLETRDEEMRRAKEKPLPAEKPLKEFALKVSDRGKALSVLQELLGRYGGKVVAAEGDTVLASLPAAGFSGFSEEMASFSSLETDETLLFTKGMRAAGEPSEVKKEQPGKVLTGTDNTVTLRIRVFTEQPH